MKLFGMNFVANPGIPPDTIQFVSADRIDTFLIEDGKLVEHNTTALSPEDAARIMRTPGKRRTSR